MCLSLPEPKKKSDSEAFFFVGLETKQDNTLLFNETLNLKTIENMPSSISKMWVGIKI